MEQSSHAAKLALHAGPSEQFWNNFESIFKLVEKRANFHLVFFCSSDGQNISVFAQEREILK